MIYTITLNPAIDYHMTLDNFEIGTTNRSSGEQLKLGGKGINVSTVLTNLGLKNTALGFIAGFTGVELETGLRQNGLSTDFIHLPQGMTRINVKLGGIAETEINANGPLIDEESFNKLLKKLENLTETDYLILAGGLPSCLPADTYEKIMQRADKATTIVDTNGSLLLNCLKYRPFLIKPNHKELGDLFDCNIDLADKDCIDNALRYAHKLQAMGARNVCVSLSYRGALLLSEKGDYYYECGKTGTVVDSVGAGDSMVAGFLAGYINSSDYSNALKYGIAAASASCFTGVLANEQNIVPYL